MAHSRMAAHERAKADKEAKLQIQRDRQRYVQVRLQQIDCSCPEQCATLFRHREYRPNKQGSRTLSSQPLSTAWWMQVTKFFSNLTFLRRSDDEIRTQEATPRECVWNVGRCTARASHPMTKFGCFESFFLTAMTGLHPLWCVARPIKLIAQKHRCRPTSRLLRLPHD